MAGARSLLLLAAMLLALAGRLHALEVQESLWGFDGGVVPARFNLCSVLVSNPGSATFDGQLTLSPANGPRAAQYCQSVYLAPRTSRWVQFFVFVSSASDEFSLRWGADGREHYDFENAPKLAAPACVWLLDAGNPFARPGALKAFPDSLFPTSAAAADGLDAVVLDYAPRWEPARRDAFLDWIARGGTVHLLRGSDGAFPTFPDTLAALNSPAERSRLGAGVIVHHAAARAEVTAKYLAVQGFPARELKTTPNPALYNLDDTLFRRLAELTRPRIQWLLIYALALGYIGLIGPAHYRWLRRRDYRVSIAAFLGVVAVFGVAFAIVGQRGYGESQTVHSFAIAHALGGGRYDVTQWSCAFATRGALYTLTHAAPVNLYFTGSNGVASGSIFNGKDGRFVADIPLYSSVPFLHRAVMNGEDFGVRVEQWETKQNVLTALRIKTGPGFPPHPTEVRVHDGTMFHEMIWQKDAYELKPGSGQLLSSFLARDRLQPRALGNKTGPDEFASAFQSALPSLYAHAVAAPDAFPQSSPPRPLAADQLQLFVAAPAPAGFRLQSPGFAREEGGVLYVLDLRKP